MKRFIKKVLMVIASFAVAFSFSFAPITASAEEFIETPEITAETPEISNATVSGEETPEEVENNAEKGNAGTETTFEDFLTWAQGEAERYGHGDEYAAAMEAIKAAATQKQVTISTVFSCLVALVVIVSIVYNKIKDKSYKKAIIELKGLLEKKLDSQLKGLNSLIDGENTILDRETKMLDSEAANGKTTEELKAEVKSIKKAFSAFISAFLRFTDGVKLGDNKKTEVQTNCLNALKEIDGEVKDEDNKM